MKRNLLSTSFGIALTVMASSVAAQSEKIPFTINLEGIQTGHAPLYISVQDAGNFRTQMGNAGIILRKQDNPTESVNLAVEPGVYAVSIWHDLDEDGQFTMGENYIPEDGWGTSGTPPHDRAPSFDEMAIEIYREGQVIDIAMQYMKNNAN